jgi:hypothetical protein
VWGWGLNNHPCNLKIFFIKANAVANNPWLFDVDYEDDVSNDHIPAHSNDPNVNVVGVGDFV